MKIFLTILLVLFRMPVYSEDEYCVFVGTFDFNEFEKLQLISDLKKIAPKENSVIIKDNKTDLMKLVFIDKFKSEKEAVLFNEKIKVDLKIYSSISFVLTANLQEKIMLNGVVSKYNLLTVKSKTDLRKSILKKKFPELNFENLSSNEIAIVIQAYEIGSKQDALIGTSAVFNKIYSYLIDSNIVDFTIEVKPIPQYEMEIALVMTSSQDLPIEELKERFRSFVMIEQGIKNKVWFSLTNGNNEQNLNVFQRAANRIKEASNVMMLAKLNDFSFTVQEINKNEAENVNKNGSIIEKESSVDLALKWLADHQEKDGHWDSGKYQGDGIPETDCAVTGITLLAFLGAGHTDRRDKYKENVGTAIKWLISAQRPNGSWDNKNYANAICTMALAEACGMGCGGKELKKYAEKAVDYLLKQQNKSGCFDYTGPSIRDDMTVTGWCIMGLKSALLTGLKEKKIREAFLKCSNYLDKVEGTNDNTSLSKGLSWYDASNQKLINLNSGAPGGGCQAVAMLVRQYLGWERTSSWLEAAATSQALIVPTKYAEADIYRVYFAYLALFQQGGEYWAAWNTPVSKMIIEAQRLDGDFRGSWDNNGCRLNKGGRVMYTAILCLALNIHYRYKAVMK